MTKREIRKKFRAQDESHLWPVCGRFNVTERAIRKVREQERANGSLSEEEYDEHIWLSLKNASFLTGKIAEALSEKDGENAGTYSSNSAEYKNKLDALDNKYADMVSKSENKTLVFADRFPFLYLTRDYGLSYYAAFPGCSAETEASFETVMFLSGKIDELGLKYIMTTESPVAGIAETVRDNTADKNAEILALDSMQSLTAEDGQNYISVMEKNLEVLEKALD